MDQQIEAVATSRSVRKPSPHRKPDETAHDKFRRLAPPRVEVALKKISLIGNLAGSGYKHEPSEAKDIIDALTRAVQEIASKFSKDSRNSRGKGFSFRSGK